MKRLYVMTLAGALCAATGMASAASGSFDSGSLNSFKSQFLPVLVQVNSAGKVTEASPAVTLPPAVARLLRQNLDELITGPANVKGQPISSQFIMNMALQTTPREDGKYDARFAYISTSPVPSGSWYWVHIDGHRLALARQGSLSDRQHRFQYHDARGDQGRYGMPSRPAVNTSPGTPSNVPAAAPASTPSK